MIISEIQVKNYKSLNDWQKIDFNSKLMTFVGKNGSGKTNILEAIAMIFEANSNTNFYNAKRYSFDYKIILELSEKELKEIDKQIECTPENRLVEVYCKNGEYTLKANRIKSKSLVEAIRRHESDLSDMVQDLNNKFSAFSSRIDALLSPDGTPAFCFEASALNNYRNPVNIIKQRVDSNIKDCKRLLNEVIVDEDEFQLNHIYNPFENIDFEKDFAFELKYIPPKLTKFEKDYIHIDEQKIGKEIERLNKVLTDDRAKISELIIKVGTLVEKIINLMENEGNCIKNSEDKYFSIIRNIQNKIRRRCFFLRNDNYGLLFNDDRYQAYEKGYASSNINERLIFESYIRTYKKNDTKQKELLTMLYENKLQIKDKKAICSALESFIKEDIPNFDKGMFVSIKAEIDENGRVSLTLVEQDKKEVPFELTSTGRRWYFTYYFIKKCIKAGDILIIDEPATFLHPQAQTEILHELEQIAKRCTVIISTHSPYMISDKIEDYYDVKMTNRGTKIEKLSIKSFAKMRSELGLVNFNSFILGREKHYVLVEGKSDVAVLSVFMRIFAVELSKYEIIQLGGAYKVSAPYQLVKSANLQYSIVLDADQENKCDIKDDKIVFVGTKTSKKSIEGLFVLDDKKKYFKKNKVCAEKIEKANKENDFDEVTINNFKKLFQELKIL